MGLKNWMNKRKEMKETQLRFGELTEDEVQDLNSTEKFAYLKVAKKQVTYRGKINAYKDFPINNNERQEIDMEDGIVEEVDVESVNDYVEDSNNGDNSELNEIPEIEPEVQEIEQVNKEEHPKNVYQTIRPV